MSKTRDTKRCFARRHLSSNETAYYNYVWGVSRRDGEFRSDDRRDAWDLKGKASAKNSITRWRQSLAKKGWIVETKKRQRNPLTGAYSSIHYRVLSHQEWVEKHGESECRDLKEYYATNGLPENSKSTTNQQVENERLSPMWGQDGDRGLSPKHDSTCPQNRFPPVPTVGTKRVVKEVCKEREENRAPSSSNPPTAMPKAKIQNQNLADLVVATAVETNRTASVSGKSKAEIVRVIGETNATEDEVVPIVRQMVECMDDFQLKNAGGAIAASLAGHVMAMRKRKTEADNQAVVHEKEMRVVQAEIDARELDLKETMAKAKAEEDRLRQHYPDDSFCACPQCQPDFWKDRDADLSAFEEGASA